MRAKGCANPALGRVYRYYLKENAAFALFLLAGERVDDPLDSGDVGVSLPPMH